MREASKRVRGKLGLSIVVPCYNEEENVRAFYNTIIKVLFGDSKEHSSLGMHSADLLKFENSQTSSLVSSSNFSKNYKSHTANIRMLGDSNAMESLESKLDSGVESVLDYKDSKDSNPLDSTLCVESNKNNPHKAKRSATLRACSGVVGDVKGEKGRRFAQVEPPSPPLKLDGVEDSNLIEDSKGLEYAKKEYLGDSKLDSPLDSTNSLESNLASTPLISSYEIIFVDDGSSDKSIDEIREIQKYDSNVRLIKLSRNFGKEAAMLAGLKGARKELVTIMDCDLQDPPSLLVKMLDLYYQNENLQMIVARRKNRAGESKIRAYFSEMFYRFNNLISSVKMHSGVRDFRLMSHEVVKSIIKLNEYHRFSKAIFEFVGYQKQYIEYEYIPRSEGSSKWSFIKLLSYGLGGIISFSITPLRIITFVGILIFLFASFYGGYMVISTLIFGNEVKGYPSMMVLISFFGGLQIIMLGIIGEYIGRIYEQSKNRPHYFIEYED